MQTNVETALVKLSRLSKQLVHTATQMTVERFLIVCIASAITLVTTIGNGEETTLDSSARSTLANLCGAIDTATGPVDSAVADRLLWTDWPDDMMPTVYAAVTKLVQQPNAYVSARSARAFAVRHKGNAAILLPYLSQALPRADGDDAVHLLVAVCEIGPQAKSLTSLVAKRLGGYDKVVGIYAASALASIVPTQDGPRHELLAYLSDDRPEIRWRAAYAVGRASTKDEKLLIRLEELLADDDVRVRVASASAVWHITNNWRTTLPVLADALSERDMPLATGHAYPSFEGDSHRVHAIGALMEMGRHASAVLPQLILIVKEGRSGDALDSPCRSLLGLAALNGIRAIGPITASDYEQLKVSVEADKSTFVHFRDEARRVLALIQLRDDRALEGQ